MTELFRDSGATTQQQVLDALVLAFRHSPMQPLATSGVLKAALEKEWKQVNPRPGNLSLKAVLAVLKMQPGFDFDRMVPALCRIKMWEPYLKMEVELPQEFLLKRIMDHASRAAACRVPDAELAKVLPSAAVALQVFSGSRLKPIAQKAPEPPPPPSRAPLVVATVLGTLLVLAGGGAGAWWWMNSQRVTVVDVLTVSDDIALTQAQRKGSAVTATLKDRTWLTFPKGERSQQVLRALTRVQAMEGVREFSLVDDTGKVLATARGARNKAPSVEMFE
jgi:hypothetical protein